MIENTDIVRKVKPFVEFLPRKQWAAVKTCWFVIRKPVQPVLISSFGNPIKEIQDLIST